MDTFWQKLEGTTEQILAEIKRLVAEFPVTIGVIGAVIAPLAAAIGALAAVLTECTIEVEKGAPSTGETSNVEGPTAT